MRLAQEIRNFAKTESARQQRTLGSLRNLFTALGALPGKKAVILASGGFAGNPAEGLVELYRRVGDAIVAAELKGEMAQLATTTDQEFERTVAAAQEARATLYAVTPQTPPDERLMAQFGSSGDTLTDIA